MEDGSTLSLKVSWAAHTDSDDEMFIHLMGSDGGASLDGNSLKLFTEQFDQKVDLNVPIPGGGA